MYPIRRFVTLIVGLIFLVPLYLCLALPASSLPASSLSLAVSDTESLSIEPPQESVWYTDDNAGSYPPSTAGDCLNCLEKRDQPIDFWATELGAKNEKYWMISFHGRKNGPTSVAGMLQRTDKELGRGAFGTVFAGTWQQPESCDVYVPTAIKLSHGRMGYFGAKNITRIKSPYVIGVYQYALIKLADSGKVDSLVGYEMLGDSAEKVWRDGTLDSANFYKEVMQGASAGAEKNIFHMDIKPENVLRSRATDASDKILRSRATDASNNAIWKLIDWDLLIEGDPQAKRKGWMGTNQYMAPEMYALRLGKSEKLWQAGPAQWFTIAIMFFYMQNPQLHQEVTPGMEVLRAEIEAITGWNPVRSKSKLFRWFWIALQVAYLKGEDTPEEILEILPPVYREGGKYSNWGKWFSKSFCRADERYNLQQAWKAFHYLELEESRVPTPSPISCDEDVDV